MIKYARLAPAVALAALVLSGCGEASSEGRAAGASPAGASPAAGDASSTDPWGDPAPATAAAKVGPGSACPDAPPIAIVESWNPKSVDVEGFETLLCEIDAKPAGIIGFIRVWQQGDGTDQPRLMMEDFLPETASEVEYRNIAGGVEARYRVDDQRQRAFAATTADGSYVVEWGGLDDEEHEAGLPAYVLARDSVMED